MHLPTNSLKQCSYIIKNSLGHVGIDSVPVHIASALDKPVVGIYSHTYSNTCDPLWNKESKAITIESDRGGKRPSFALEENPKTINFIKPEKIAQSVLEVLGIDKEIKEKTIFMGPRSMLECIEVIPSEPTSFEGGPISVRMDLHHNEEVLKQIIQFAPVEVTLNRPISAEILASKKIQRLTYEADSFDEDFIETLTKFGINATLVCSSSKNLEKERTKHFNCLIHKTKKHSTIKGNKEKLKGINLNSLKIKSNKKIICGDKIYESLFDKNDRKNEDDFFVDLDWLMVYDVPDE